MNLQANQYLRAIIDALRNKTVVRVCAGNRPEDRSGAQGAKAERYFGSNIPLMMEEEDA